MCKDVTLEVTPLNVFYAYVCLPLYGSDAVVCIIGIVKDVHGTEVVNSHYG